MKQSALLLLLIGLLLGCENKNSAEEIVSATIKHYFPSGLENKKISFDFRGRSYTTSRYADKFIYTRSFEDSTEAVNDILVNSTEFTRMINGDTVDLDQEWIDKYTSSVNSVLYFLQIPYVLNDPAAIKKLVGEEVINGKSYWSVFVTFQQQQGGEDHDDEFLYWIGKEDYALDYFAYNYAVDGGGVRFREAINQRRVEGLLFQDYINYEVELGTPLKEIPQLFREGKLKELSRIINENISVSTL